MLTGAFFDEELLLQANDRCFNTLELPVDL